MGGRCAGTKGRVGTGGAGGGRGGAANDGGGATPIVVRLTETGIFGAPTGVGGGAGPGVAFGFVTRNEWPHLGHRIFRPVGGTRRSSIWYGALHDSHSTFNIDPLEPITRYCRDGIPPPIATSCRCLLP